MSSLYRFLRHTFVVLTLTTSIAAQAQTALSEADSIRCDDLKAKAFQEPLHSRLRERYLDSALRLAPHDAYLWQQRAMPIFKIRQYEAGMPFLDSAVKYDPASYLPYRAFMNCIFRKNYRDALLDFDAAQRWNGNSGVMDHPYDFYPGPVLPPAPAV